MARNFRIRSYLSRGFTFYRFKFSFKGRTVTGGGYKSEAEAREGAQKKYDEKVGYADLTQTKDIHFWVCARQPRDSPEEVMQFIEKQVDSSNKLVREIKTSLVFLKKIRLERIELGTKLFNAYGEGTYFVIERKSPASPILGFWKIVVLISGERDMNRVNVTPNEQGEWESSFQMLRRQSKEPITRAQLYLFKLAAKCLEDSKTRPKPKISSPQQNKKRPFTKKKLIPVHKRLGGRACAPEVDRAVSLIKEGKYNHNKSLAKMLIAEFKESVWASEPETRLEHLANTAIKSATTRIRRDNRKLTKARSIKK